ncbi:MAG: Rpn family recombination-promoting nuclease/putative transposase [Eubacterium sp.]|nr:Rpn family recombination-promoting nuclease/putative transposase [Eubacterium sp.]
MQKDLPEKLLEEYNDVFTDIVNVLLFGGKSVIKEDELQDFLPVSQYKAEKGILHEEERDIGKRWSKGSFIISSLGLENQNKYFKNMPVRVIGYDGANYREQLLKGEDSRIYPVVTLVLNFSMHRWKKNRTLYECMDIPEELKPYVSDYRINVFDIAFLSDEQIEMFHSDFKIVAKYFADRRKKRKFEFPTKMPKHVDEVMKILTALTGDIRFTEGWKIIDSEDNDTKEGENMAEKWIDEIEERGEKRGIEIGKIEAYNDAGFSIETIAEKVGTTIENVKKVLGLITEPQ